MNWKYRIKPGLRINALTYAGKTFYHDAWTETVERLVGSWYKEYLIEREMPGIQPVKQEVVLEVSSDTVETPAKASTKRK